MENITAHRLKELRKQKGTTMEKMALETGIKKPTISNYENGYSKPKDNNLKKLANYYSVSPSYILGYSDELMTFDTGEEFEKARQKMLNTPSQGKEIALAYGKGNELKNVKVKEISLQDSYKKIAANIAGSLSNINNEKWLEYGTLLLKSEKENS